MKSYKNKILLSKVIVITCVSIPYWMLKGQSGPWSRRKEEGRGRREKEGRRENLLTQIPSFLITCCDLTGQVCVAYTESRFNLENKCIKVCPTVVFFSTYVREIKDEERRKLFIDLFLLTHKGDQPQTLCSSHLHPDGTTTCPFPFLLSVTGQTIFLF